MEIYHAHTNECCILNIVSKPTIKNMVMVQIFAIMSKKFKGSSQEENNY
jgi:hypothetical protein